jgi:hypothetical protein
MVSVRFTVAVAEVGPGGFPEVKTIGLPSTVKVIVPAIVSL